MLYRRGALLARAVDLEHDRTPRDDPAIASLAKQQRGETAERVAKA
jgi:hypothetical protein